MRPKPKDTEEDVTMEEKTEPQKRMRKKSLIDELENPTEETELPEPQEAQDTGGAAGSRQPYQPIPRTDEPTMQEMTSAPNVL